MDDLEFVRRCASGDKQAWDEFVERYSRLIYRYIINTLRAKAVSPFQEHAADIFQEIFASLAEDKCRRLRSFRGQNGASLASWLRQVAIHAALNYARKIKPAVSIDEETGAGLNLKDILPDGGPAQPERLSLAEQMQALKDCINGLQTSDRFFLELHINRGIALEKLRGALRLSRGAVDMRKSRIISRLQDCFRQKGFALD
jgi:RNA polymerase sigma factor (sigma-70 family)